MCNSGLLSRLCDVFESYTVGVGLPVHPASSDWLWNKAASDSFRGWERYCDLVSMQSFGTLCGQIARAWFVDGECFVLKTRGETGRPRLQLIEAHRVETPDKLEDQEGVTIFDGIEIAPKSSPTRGRPVAYWIEEEDGGPNGECVYRRVPAEDMIHVFEPERAGQYRGIPFCASVLNDLDALEELQLLEQKAARAGSVFAMAITNSAGEFDTDDILATGGSVTKSSSGVASAYRESVGGEIISLRTGEDIKAINSGRPTVATKEYWQFVTDKICAGVGIPSAVAFPDSMQGTVYRATLDMTSQWFKARSSVMQGFVRRVYEWVIEFEIARNPILAKAPNDWRNVRLYAPRAINVDVGRNSSALLAELQAGVTTYADAYGPLGLDWREQFDALAEQKRYAESLGILQPSQPQQQQAQP